jgi:hypothetical protein
MCLKYFNFLESSHLEDSDEDEEINPFGDDGNEADENIHSIEEDEDEEEEEEDDDDDEEDEEDEENDIESAMNAILGGPTIESTKSNGGSSGLSSKNYFLSNFCGTTANQQTGSSLSESSACGVYPKLELLINDHVLPTNMTIYQAIKQFGSSGTPVASTDQSMLTENDAENTSLINNAIWSKVHLIHYRIAQSSNTSAASTAAAATTEVSSKASTSKETDTKRSTRNSITKQQTSSTSSTLPIVTKKQQGSTKNDNDSSLDVVTDSNLNSITNTTGGLDVSLTNFLNKLTSSKSKLEENINDRSIDSILLLRLLSSVNREWLLMYKDVLSLESIFTFTNTNNDLATQSSAFLTGMNEFVNTKLTAKANRQLQDPLVVMTGKTHELIFKGKKMMILK